MTHRPLLSCLTFGLSLVLSRACLAGDLSLPAPKATSTMPVMEALAKRSSAKSFSSQELERQQLANVLWAGFGVNRPDGRRTAPSANNAQELELYVLLKEGVYVYDAKQQLLKWVSDEDVRALGGNATAPVTLIYVAQLSKREQGTIEQKKNVACIDSGFVSENIYLYCASEGLVTRYRGGFDKAALPAKLHLNEDQALIAAQSVGYPVEVH